MSAHEAGYELEPIAGADCERFLAWVLGEAGGAGPERPAGLAWLREVNRRRKQ